MTKLASSQHRFALGPAADLVGRFVKPHAKSRWSYGLGVSVLLCAVSALAQRPDIEIDHFEATTAKITLQFGGGTEDVNLVGPTTVHVFIGPNGETGDGDQNGLDEAPTALVEMNLAGNSSLGPLRVTVNPEFPSPGRIEELVNNTPGILDLPPFAETGEADSFFDVFVEIHVEGQILHPANPLHMQSIIRHKPPAPGDEYMNPFTQPVPLLDENGNPTGIAIVQEIHTPNPVNPPPIEIDHFPATRAQIVLQSQGGPTGGGTEQVNLVGPTTVHVLIAPDGSGALDLDGDGRDQVQTEMTEMSLTGNSSLGPVLVKLNPMRSSYGQIQERTNNMPGRLDVPPFAPSGLADSFFDVFAEIHVNGQVLYPANPLRMESVIRHKPPALGDQYVNPFTSPVPLVDANGTQSGLFLMGEIHTPNPTNPPPVEIDHFEATTAQLTLQLPANGGTEQVNLSGPTTVHVLIGPNGESNDFDSNGRDQVQTEMTEMSLTGNSSLGPVVVKLDPRRTSYGQIEEQVNDTPGILDLPPFAPTGMADSFFDVFVEIQLEGKILHPANPLHMASVIRHKPPAPGDDYVNPFTQPIQLLDENGNGTGIFVVQEIHTPNPTNPPPVEVDHFPATTAQVTLQLPSGGSEQVDLSGPSTVHVLIGPVGDATDLDGDGLDQVQTEMVEMSLTGNSSLGPVHVKLNPMHSSYGQIEERTNNTPGILDIPPFAPIGDADSFFDVFVEIHVNGQTLLPTRPLRMQSVIRHKPPAPGDQYINPFTQPVPLLDANGNPTGILIVQEIHTPNPTNPPPVEIDHFPATTARILLQLPDDGGSEQVDLSGPSTVHVLIGPEGEASDFDGDGRDQVQTEMVEMSLTGNSSLGPVLVKLDPTRSSYGQIEEQVNDTPGILDIPPFAPKGQADSFFDIFAEIHVNGQVLRPANPLRMVSVIRHKPPAPGDQYINPFAQPVPLLDANGNPTGIFIVEEVHTPNPTNPPPVEIDHFPATTAQLALQLPGGSSEQVDLSGPTTVHVLIGPEGEASDLDGDGLDQVQTEMVALSLTGNSSLGPIHVSLDSKHSSYGQIEERANNTPGILDLPPFAPSGDADSFFDVFVEIQVEGQTLHPANPLRVQSVIRHKPPAPGDEYVNPFTQPVPLLDENGNPTGIYVVREVHTPNPTNPPPVEIDHFPATRAQLQLQLAAGGTEQVNLVGPTTVHVLIGPNGESTDFDADGLDQVQTEMVEMSLAGNSSLGPVLVKLDPARPSLGQIEEQANDTPGILDVPPFAPTGEADSFFDVFVEIHVAGQTLHPANPLRMHSVIRHKPPAPGDDYINPFTQPVPLLDENGNPTGILIVQEIHTPNPTNPPPVEIDQFPATTAQITLQMPLGGTEQVNLMGPTTVHVLIAPDGTGALDVDGDGREQVQTEMVQMDLTGDSSLGPVMVRLDPRRASYGEIEEQANNTPDKLDVPPFTATGLADSFFDVFVEIQLGSQILRPAVPLHMQSMIRHKPPAPGDDYVNPFKQPIELLDENGNPTGIFIVEEVHTPNPTNALELNCSSNITAVATSPNGAVVTFNSSATGGCDPVTVSCNPPSGSTFPIGTTTVTCTAIDACTNRTECSFTVTVVRPSITIQPKGDQLQLEWNGGILQEADEVEGPYRDIQPQPTSPFTVFPTGEKKFIRVRVGQPPS